MSSVEQFDLIVAIAQRAVPMMRRHVEGITYLDIAMDIGCTHRAVPLDLQELLDFDDASFELDIAGIYLNFNPESLKMENCFIPRCAVKREGFLATLIT